jgi:hypothetical protein
MTEVVIRNQQFMDRLNEISDELLGTSGYNDRKYWARHSDEGITAGTKYTDEEYLREVSLKGQLVGAADKHYAQPIAKMCREDPDIWDGFRNRVKFEFAKEIGAHSSALLTYYPPGGYVGWHTNYDANAYQILFTWSDGNGYFRYYDKEKDEIIHLPDVKGWQCRHYYFGSKREPENICWHSAYSGGERITLAYKFVNNGIANNDSKDKQAKFMRDMLIEEIEEK